MVRTTKRLGGCGTIAILLVRLSDPRTDDLAGRCKAMCQALAARGSRSPLGVVVVPLDDALDGAMERGKWDAFCASAPADWLSIHYGNASYIVAETDLLRRCRVFSQEQLPSLCLFTASGRLINASASGSLASDPEAKGFPWASSTSTSWALALSVAAPVAAVAAYYLASRYFCWSRLTS